MTRGYRKIESATGLMRVPFLRACNIFKHFLYDNWNNAPCSDELLRASPLVFTKHLFNYYHGLTLSISTRESLKENYLNMNRSERNEIIV